VAAWLEAIHDKTDTNQMRLKAKTEHQEKMDAWIAVMRDVQKETMLYQVTMEVYLECEKPTSAVMMSFQEMTACHEATETDTKKAEPNPGMIQSVEGHQKVPKKETAVMPVGGLKKWRRDKNLAMEHLQTPEERTRGYCGSWRRVAHCTRVAWLRRGVIRMDCTRAKVKQAHRQDPLSLTHRA
jgi:hypothetical protein